VVAKSVRIPWTTSPMTFHKKMRSKSSLSRSAWRSQLFGDGISLGGVRGADLRQQKSSERAQLSKPLCRATSHYRKNSWKVRTTGKTTRGFRAQASAAHAVNESVYSDWIEP